MAARSSLPLLEDTTWAYLAGLVDGEGTITILRRRSSRHATMVEYGVSVQISQKERMILDWIKETLQAGSVIVKRTDANERGFAHAWVASSNVAYLMVKGMRPFLKIKARQADIILAFQETKREWDTRRRQIGFAGTISAPPELLARNQAWLEEVQSINRRHFKVK